MELHFFQIDDFKLIKKIWKRKIVFYFFNMNSYSRQLTGNINRNIDVIGKAVVFFTDMLRKKDIKNQVPYTHKKFHKKISLNFNHFFSWITTAIKTEIFDYIFIRNFFFLFFKQCPLGKKIVFFLFYFSDHFHT